MSNTHLKLRPILDNVHLERLQPPARSAGGLILPGAFRQHEQRARVLAVGPGRWTSDGKTRIPPQVKVGDIVRLPYMRGADINEDGTQNGKALILHEEELLGVEES
jgi:chaperonin GroES